jgi:tetratricopeptide (TPR) repeat protein
MTLLIPAVASGEECSLERLWTRKKSAKSVMISPFQLPKSSQTGLSLLATVLLKDYLSLAKDLAILPIPDPTASSTTGTAAYLLGGRLTPETEGFRLEGSLRSAADGSEIYRFEGRFEFPNGLNELLIRLVEEISAALKSKVEAKKLLPYLNVTASPSAYLAFAEGRLKLDHPTAPSLEKAVKDFEQAIQADYNYVPAYLGLAEALAGLAALGQEGYASRARREMEKAKLLNPVLTKIRISRIEKYLKAQKKDFCD